MQRSSVLFPEPGRADHAGRFPRRHIEIDVMQNLGLPEALAQLANDDRGIAHAAANRNRERRASAEAPEPAADLDQPPIEQGEQKQRFDEGIKFRADGADRQRKFRHGDDRHDRGLLQQDHRHVHASRKHEHRHFRQQDAAHDLRAREADAFARLDMAGRHRFKPGAENLAEIGGAIDGKSEQAGGDRVERKADIGAAEIEQEELDQKRRAAKHLDIGAKRQIEPARSKPARDRDEKAEDAGADEPDDPDEQRDAERMKDLGQLRSRRARSRTSCAPPAEPALGCSAREGEAAVDEEIEQARGRVELDRLVEAGVEVLRHAREFDDADDRDQRRRLEDEDRLIDKRGQRQAERDRRADAHQLLKRD